MPEALISEFTGVGETGYAAVNRQPVGYLIVAAGRGA